MKKFILLLILVVYGFGDSCYTVQLMTKYKTNKNKIQLSHTNFPKGCLVMEIGNFYTVRCECRDTKEEIKQKFPFYKKRYHGAVITKSARYRFQKQPKKIIKKKVIVVPKTNEKLIPHKKIILKKPKKEAVKNVETIQVLPPKIIRKPLLIKRTTHKEDKHKKKLKKEKKKYKEKKTKKHKKEKYKFKYVKKRDMHNFYDRYIARLRHKEGIGKYDFRYQFGAKIKYDVMFGDEAGQSYLHHQFRGVQIYHKGSFFGKKLFYKMGYEFSNITVNHIKDLYLGYKGKIKKTKTKYRIKFGNFKVPFSLSQSDMFMEGALNNTFIDGRNFGGELLLSQQIARGYLNLFTSYYQGSINDRIHHNQLDKGTISARVTYAKAFTKHHIISFGSGYAKEKFLDGTLKYKQGSESKFMYEQYVSTKIKYVSSVQKNNFEFLYIFSKYCMQAAYTQVAVKNNLDIYKYDGYYIEGSYFYLGQGRGYDVKKSTLEQIQPNRDGAIEFALRYSAINLNSSGKKHIKDESGGSQQDIAFGVNWYYNKEIEWMFNYILAFPKATKDYDGMLQVYQTRLIFAF
ncbi:Phosphate-specific outer membrane porin OprP; Pyrophosphate-specific outer membrane porin OprO [hydrothermal vent metagenome]|uniref:Phosphate-specific outer membrane porin OprP Pyrophosphate-specific outer membrane porin OprO n=2 Tax=hydrothermal vent metagenome TaxID=652676 RepID=A0A1W1BJ11_9ZZZZ